MVGKKIAIYWIIYSIFLVIVLNILSAFHQLTRSSLNICMIIFVISFVKNVYKFAKEIYDGCVRWVKNTHSSDKTVDMVLTLLIFITLGLAIFTVPYNGDSLDYHLPRIMHWIQDRSVNYNTLNAYDLRETISPVLGEYYMLHNYLIFGSDIMINLVQWFSYVAAIFFITENCKKIGVNALLSKVAGLIFATMPITIAESITTQVDLVACMWVSISLFFLIDLIKIDHFSIRDNYKTLLFASCSIGFAYLSKSSSCIYIFAFLMGLLVVRIIKKDRIRDLIFATIFSLSIVVMVTSETFIRSLLFFGSFTPSEYNSSLTVGSLAPKYLFLNFYKNYSILFVNDYFDACKDILVRLGYGLADLFNADLNSSLISFSSGYFEDWIAVSYHHDLAGAPCLLFILFFAIGYFFNSKRKKLSMRFSLVEDYFVFSALFGFLLSLFSIRWQAWGTRLMLPSLVGIPIVIVVLLDKCKNVKNSLIAVIVFAITVTSFKAIEYNSWRAISYISSGLKGRNSYYLSSQYSIDDYEAISKEIIDNHASSLGIIVNGEKHEYILWKLLRDDNIHIEHIAVDYPNFDKYIKRELSNTSFVPDYIFVGMDYKDDTILCQQQRYTKVNLSGEKERFYLFVKEGD